ncbi:MAG: hypothetical protein J07HQX50_01740 [Haloquadratum sp. J07HQX50]|nr:MAG: hypothetical protein J07HQX50_01740 [Haloquadratum sp. J07HQX50]
MEDCYLLENTEHEPVALSGCFVEYQDVGMDASEMLPELEVTGDRHSYWKTTLRFATTNLLLFLIISVLVYALYMFERPLIDSLTCTGCMRFNSIQFDV